MKKIPPYVVVALCGLAFISAGLIGMFANNADGTAVTDPAAQEVLPTETPTLTPTPTEVIAPVEVAPPVVVEQQPAAPVQVAVVPADVQPIPPAPVENVPPAEAAPVAVVPADVQPIPPLPVESIPAEGVPADVLPVEAAPIEAIPEQPAPVESVPVEGAPVESAPAEAAQAQPVVEVTPEQVNGAMDAAAAPEATRSEPVDSVSVPTAVPPAADVTVPVQPVGVDVTPVAPTLDPALQPTLEVVVPTNVPADAVVPAVPAHVSGVITFQDAPDHSGIVILLTLPDGTQLQNTTGAPGTFEFLNLQPGMYRAEARATGYLSRQVEFTLAEGEALQLPATFLVGGDTNQDNIIDLSDAALVALNFDGPAPDTTSDPNRDGWIDVRDLALIGADYGLSGPIPWQ